MKENKRWYKDKNILSAIITGAFILVGAIITSPLWLAKKNSAERYSSKSPTKDTRTMRASSEDTILETELVYGLVSLEIKENVSRPQMESVLRKIRNSRNLRELMSIETGKRMVDIPNGTYFYIWAAELRKTALFPTVFESIMKLSSVKRFPDRPSDFEIHKVSGELVLLVAFTTNESASLISTLNGKEEKRVTLSPICWDNTNTLVLIPLERILDADSRFIQITKKEGISILDCVLR